MAPCAGDASIDQHHRGDPTRGSADLGRVQALEEVVAGSVAEDVGIECRQQLHRVVEPRFLGGGDIGGEQIEAHTFDFDMRDLLRKA